MANIGVSYCLHDDHLYLQKSIASFCSFGLNVTAFISKSAWDKSHGEWELCAEAAQAVNGEVEVVTGDWGDESLHRTHALAAMRERGYDYVLIPDGDEVIEPSLLESLLKIATTDLAGAVRVHMDTYWWSPQYRIRPREALTPLLLLDARRAQHRHIREYEASPLITLGPEFGVLHHLSYAGPDERIKRKIETWSHKHELVSNWYPRVFQGWSGDRLMENLHPTHPAAYGFAERCEVPEILLGTPDPRPSFEEPAVPQAWPKVSVVIPLYGGEDDIKACLTGLEHCRELLHEVIVVDDASLDEAPTVAASFAFVKLLHNEENRGFAATCNKGYAASSGDVLLFLNSDAILPRSGLIRLIESLMKSGSIAAAGPCSNGVGYFQRVAPTYTSLDTLDLFAQDFAHRPVEDRDVDMLVGFCLAVKRSMLAEVGSFDERFGIGMFEETDLCYRLRRAGYRLRVASKAYAHHAGSHSLARHSISPEELLERNRVIYVDKWREDLECGFVDRLPGLSMEPVKFDANRHPEVVRRQMIEQARLADVSLCMIVKNEERVIRECLKSVQGFFTQVVVIDTGSTDRTKEIATELGAEVHDFPWTESFADARNESIRHARGRWIFWLDADDTLPRATADAVINSALNAPENVSGFVVPVQFVEDGPGAGTRVDHVKLFRNLKGLTWEGRIHEQILPSLRTLHGGLIARIDFPVMHSGYDTSPDGQARKRQRDWRLLELDLQERPNHPFVHFNIGMTHHYSGEHEQAVASLRQSIKLAQPGESHVRKAYSLLAVSLRDSGDSRGAEETLHEGLAVVGEDPELRFHLGLLLTAQGRFEEARENYLLVSETNDGHFSSLDVGILGVKRDHNLASVCMSLGKYMEARELWRRAITASPPFLPSAVEMFNFALEQGDLAVAREAMLAVKNAQGASESWCEMQMRYCTVVGTSIDEFLWEAARQNPGAVGPRLHLARRLLEGGDETRAQPFLEDLQRRGVAEAAYLRGVCATRRGDFEAALVLMREALRMNPEHELTAQQVLALEQAVAL